MPQTFSVYVLKKMRYSRSPNWFESQASSVVGLGLGRTFAPA